MRRTHASTGSGAEGRSARGGDKEVKRVSDKVDELSRTVAMQAVEIQNLRATVQQLHMYIHLVAQQQQQPKGDGSGSSNGVLAPNPRKRKATPQDQPDKPDDSQAAAAILRMSSGSYPQPGMPLARYSTAVSAAEGTVAMPTGGEEIGRVPSGASVDLMRLGSINSIGGLSALGSFDGQELVKINSLYEGSLDADPMLRAPGGKNAGDR